MLRTRLDWLMQAAGYNANDIRKAGTHSAWELRTAGYSLEELKGAGEHHHERIYMTSH